MSSDIVNLNVGGVKYSTTRSTLCKYPDSMLGAMFSQNMPSNVDKDGYYFIDRNGKIFEYILQYLRSDELSLPKEFKDFDLLKREMDFFQIKPLIEKTVEEKVKYIIFYYKYLDNDQILKYVKHHCRSINENEFEIIFSQTKISEREYKKRSLGTRTWILKEEIDVSNCNELVAFILSFNFSKATKEKFMEHLEDIDYYQSGKIHLYSKN